MPVKTQEYQALASKLKQLHMTYQEVLDVGLKIEYCQVEDVNKWMNTRHRLIARGQELSEHLLLYLHNEEWMSALSQSQSAWVHEFRQSIVELEPAVLQQHHQLVQIIRKKSQNLRGQLVQQNTQTRAINAYVNAPGSRMIA